MTEITDARHAFMLLVRDDEGHLIASEDAMTLATERYEETEDHVSCRLREDLDDDWMQKEGTLDRREFEAWWLDVCEEIAQTELEDEDCW